MLLKLDFQNDLRQGRIQGLLPRLHGVPLHLRSQQRVLVGLLSLLPRGALAPGPGQRLRVPHGRPVLVCDVFRLRVEPADQPPRSGSGPRSGEPASHSGDRPPTVAARRSQHLHEGSDGENVVVGALQVTALFKRA